MTDTHDPRHGTQAPHVPDLDRYRDRLIDACRGQDGVTSLVLYGSATTAQRGRRDGWSDVDFNIFFTAEANERLRATWPFLPDRDRIVLLAREGENGGIALYDDGMLFEFGAGLPWDIRDPAREIALDGGDLRFAEPPAAPPAADEIGLFLVKLYLALGRHRRGERLSANALLHGAALTSLCWALRDRLAPEVATTATTPTTSTTPATSTTPTNPTSAASPFDPLRRIEQALPAAARRVADLLDRDLETCGRGLFDLARELLEPGWAEFPSAAADVVGSRLGWGP